MNIRVAVILMLVCMSLISLSEAGKKKRLGKERKQKKGKTKRESTDGSDQGSSHVELEDLVPIPANTDQSADRDACLRPSKKKLKLELDILQSRQRSGRVYIVPTLGGGAIHSTDGHREIGRREIGRCREVQYENVDQNRIPHTIFNVECQCVDCGLSETCLPIEYVHPVLRLSSSEPCLDGLMQYEKSTTNVIAGCKYVVIE